MGNIASRESRVQSHEYRFVLVAGLAALAIASVPYALAAALATDQRVFGGFVYAVEDGYSYLAKMRQGAEGAWLFRIAYTPEPHPGSLFFAFHLLLGKLAPLLPGDDLTSSVVWVYHLARWLFGFGLLLTLYRFLAAFTRRVMVRRIAWLMVTFGGGLGWLLVSLGRPHWLGSLPLDFILPEGFTFLVLYAFPHIALARTLLLGGLLTLLVAWRVDPLSGRHANPPGSPDLYLTPIGWALVTGLLWLVMGFIVPFYVPVVWAVMGAAWVVLALREGRLPRGQAVVTGVTVLISAPVVLYSAWRFTSHPVYAAWASQNQILSPHPFHYLAAYGILLVLAACGVTEAWHSASPAWLALAWVGVVPFLIYLPFNLQRRLVEGVQVPLSLLAAMGLARIVGLPSASFAVSGPNSHGPGSGGSGCESPPSVPAATTGLRLTLRSRFALILVLSTLVLTNAMLIAGSAAALRSLPAPVFRDAAEVAALDWLALHVERHNVILASYETGNYLPARVAARAFVGHGPESVNASAKRALVARFFAATADDAWRQEFLAHYGIDYLFWGPAERELGAFDPEGVDYLRCVYDRDAYLFFEVLP